MVDEAAIPNWPFDKQVGYYKMVFGRGEEKPYFLGQGIFGRVILGWDTKNNRKVAIKIMDKVKVLKSQKAQEQLQREIAIMKPMISENIVQLFDTIEFDNSVYLVIELCDSSLDVYKAKLDTVDKKYSIIIDVIRGFKTLSENNIIHRDIKSENILILNGKAKISDFGFAKVKEGDPNEVHEGTQVGTPLHMAPQILIGEDFSAKCDVFSVGVLAFTLLFDSHPWNGINFGQIYFNTVNTPLIIPAQPEIDNDLKTLLTNMLVPDEEGRFSWPEVFASDFVKSRI